jgi:prepilin-type N-terminal cleavage/methylation domain-containing protein
MQKDSGLTIFELMTVVAIIAILSSIALPGFMSWLPNYRMRSASDELLSILWLSQKRAARENADVAIDFDFANDSYVACIVVSDNGTCDPGEQIIKRVQMHPGIDLENVDLGNFQFDRRGFPTDVANNPVSGNLTVSNDSQTRTINLTLAGSLSIQ